MKIIETTLKGPLLVEPRRFEDERGFFSETFNQAAWSALGVDLVWVQDNHSRSFNVGVVRGLHWQNPPLAQTKLVRVTRGCILDVVVDIRVGSPTYGQHECFELSADNWHQLLVPVGFAHGFCTLTDDTEVLYKVSAPYTAEAEAGLGWCDAGLGIEWPVSEDKAVLSPRDKSWPHFSALQSPFRFGPQT